MPPSTTFQKSSLYVCEAAAGSGTTLENIQLRLLQDKFTSFMFPPFFVSIAGAFMKCKSIHSCLYQARLNTDIASLSNGGLSNSQHTSALRFAPASQISLLWRTPWIYTTFGRAYASAAESRKREMRVLDEVEDDDHGDEVEDDNRGDVQESSEFEEGSDVEDEQRIEDSDDDEEEDQQPQSQGPAKKKIQTQAHKSKSADQQGRVMNQDITARTIRLVNDDTKSHRIVSRDEALTLAKEKRMDLVLVDSRPNPPVCKIFDFNKEEYRQEQILKDRKKQKGATAHLNEVKELRFNSKTEPKDLKMKVEQAKVFMDRGYRVKFVALFKGRPDDEMKRLEEEKMIDAILPMIEDVAAIEQGPRVESRQAWVMLRHLKFSKKKPPKRQPQISATERVENVKQDDYAYSEPDFNQGQEEIITHAQNASNVSEAEAKGSFQGYPSKLTSPSTKPFTFQSSHPQVQPRPRQDLVDAFSPQKFSLPLHGFPEATQPLKGFRGSQGSERAISPPLGLEPSMPASQRAGVQGVKVPTLRPSKSPLPASSLQGAQIHESQVSPLDGLSPPQSEEHPFHTPKISMPSQSPRILSQKPSSNNAPHPNKAIGSEAARGEYPAASRGRGIPPPNQPAHSLFSSTPPTSLQGSPSNLQGPLLNFSQSPQMPTGIPRHSPANLRGPFPNASPSVQENLLPSNLQGPLLNFSQSPQMPTGIPRHSPAKLGGPFPNASPSLQENLSHQGGLSNVESPLTDFFPSLGPPTLQHAPSSSQSSQSYPSPFVPSQNVQKRDALPSHGSEGLPPRGVPQYPPSPLQGLPPRGTPPRYPPPPIGQPSYAPSLGQPNFQDLQRAQSQFATDNQTQQLRGPDSMHQARPALNAAAAQEFPQVQNYKPEQGQGRYAPAPNVFGSPQRPQQGSPQPPQQGPLNPFGAPGYPQQGPPSFFGSPQRPQQGPSDLVGSTHRPQQGYPSLFGTPPPPQQAPPNLFGTPLRPQQAPPSPFGSPLRPQQAPPSAFGSQPYIQQRPPEPSPNVFGHQPDGVPQGPRQGPWLSQQAPPRHHSPMPSHPQQAWQLPSQDHQGHLSQQEAEGGPWMSQQPPSRHPSPMRQPPSQGQQGYLAQQEAEGAGQNYWESQASQVYPGQRNQVPQSYPPPQRSLPQARGPFGFQENHTQNQAFQQPPPPRGFPQTRPGVPSPPGYRPAWSNPPQSQEYSPLFELPSEKS